MRPAQATEAAQRAEQVARESYGRLVAILAARTHDVAAAEDALADALARALEDWPRSGIPRTPEAWLLTVARRRLLDAYRHRKVQDEAQDTLLLLSDELLETSAELPFPDERLKLLFLCAHPAIDEAVRTPLMLQAVLGLDAARIASAFLTSPATLSQRLVRAKNKIRAAGIPFELPNAGDLPDRMQDVLDAIYAAYGTGWDAIDGVDQKVAGLALEALQLADAMVALMPDEPEPLGLAALLLFCEARAPARRDDAGDYVALSEQDVSRWQRPLIERAEKLLVQAARAERPGPYQLEAAIQSAHCQVMRGATVPPQALFMLYEGLVSLRPSLGALVSRACVLEQVAGAEEALAALDELPAERTASYQPYWAARAHLLHSAGRREDASQALDRAIALAHSPAVKRFLVKRYLSVKPAPA